MDLESILKEYGKSMHVDKLQLDKSGLCTILINDNFLVTFEKSLDREGFYVYAKIGNLSPSNEKEVALMVLEGNLFGKETGQANIGYVNPSRTLVLFEYFDKNFTDYVHFSQRFNDFLQHLFYWIVKLESSAQLTHQPSLKHNIEHTHIHKKIFYA